MGHSALNYRLSTSPILFVANLFHPLYDFSIERFLNGDVRHRGRRRSAVPMLLVRRKPDNITRSDFFDRSAPTLRPSKPERDDQRLTERMRMPGGASTRLKHHARAANTCRSKSRRGEFGCLEQRINPNRAGEPISWSFRGSLRTRSFYLHLTNVVASRLLSTP